jgi:SAM-dependent methyltransferase
VQGFEPQAYGDAMAEVYDDWYSDISDADATVAAVVGLVRAAGGGPVLELGVGTGRLALPLAAAGLHVTGIDVSAAMLERLRTKPGADAVTLVHGDMASGLPEGPFAVVLVAFNTFFSLTTADAQQRCLAHVADRLASRGRFALEAFVPDEERIDAGSRVEVRSLSRDRVVLTVSRHDAELQRAEGQFVELSEAGGVRLRPWSLRYAGPAELDRMARAAGLELVSRWSSWAGAAFDADSSNHVSLYRRVGSADA